MVNVLTVDVIVDARDELVAFSDVCIESTRMAAEELFVETAEFTVVIDAARDWLLVVATAEIPSMRRAALDELVLVVVVNEVMDDRNDADAT